MGVIFVVSGLFLLGSFGFLIGDSNICGKYPYNWSTYFVLIIIVLSGIFSFIYGIVYLSRHFEDVQILAKYVNHDKTIITSEFILGGSSVAITAICISIVFMKTEDGVILEATIKELKNLYMRDEYDKIMSWKDFINTLKNQGTIILDK